MPVLKLELDLSESALQQIDHLRCDYPRNDFLARCLELGINEVSDEANRVYREAQFMTMLNRTKDFAETRKQRGIAVSDAPPELNFQGSGRRVTAA